MNRHITVSVQLPDRMLPPLLPAARVLRANTLWYTRLRDIPVVVISGVDLNPDQRRQLENLGKRLLQKGMLTEDELFATLEKALKEFKSVN